MDSETSRRFAGAVRLYGLLQRAHVYLVGIGGVGSWAAEALVRTGIDELTLIDMDSIAESNINRQLHATSDTLGENKIDVMAKRCQSINPNCQVHLRDDFLRADNVAELLPANSCTDSGKIAIVLDCTDDMHAKLAIALHCRFSKIKLVVAGGAGGKTDPSKITVADLKDVSQDPLLAKLRQKLRSHGINRALKEKFAIKCVYSSESPARTKQCSNRLACGGYGSAVVVTSVVGMVMAHVCLGWLRQD